MASQRRACFYSKRTFRQQDWARLGKLTRRQNQVNVTGRPAVGQFPDTAFNQELTPILAKLRRVETNSG
jgi:hypothetical protein